MTKIGKQILAGLMSAVLLCGTGVQALAVDRSQLDAVAEDTAAYIYRVVPEPQVGSIGGEWAVIGLARGDYEVPESYYQKYVQTVEDYVEDCKGVLHEKKYTEYSRVVTALSAVGKDARSVAGYDLTKALGDYEKVIWQGLNGPIWALIALDSQNYPMPKNPEAKVQATRQMYVDRILDCQLPDGGWSLFGGTEAAKPDEVSDPDITGMALQALAKYQDQPAVAQATEEALTCMSKMQDAEGGFSAWGEKNSESCVQMIVGLCELGITLDDPRFVKNGNTILDALMTYYRPGKGFLHTDSGEGSNQMSSEQGLYSVVAVQRALNGENSLYRMGDTPLKNGETEDPSAQVGLPNKHADVQSRPVTRPGRSFADIAGIPQKAAIEALASRGIINGKTETAFDPNANMTRAEFAAIIVQALGLTPKASGVFVDVPQSAWYAPYVGAAAEYGIVSGVGAGKFNPGGTITRQEAAVMVSRAGTLCGMDTELNHNEVRDMLAQFSDYRTIASWAQQGLAFCYQEAILDQSDLEVRPSVAILRCEIAQMVYNLLEQSKLL